MCAGTAPLTARSVEGRLRRTDALMPTSREYLDRVEGCLRLAEETDQAFARDALLELATKFQAIAVQIELRTVHRRH